MRGSCSDPDQPLRWWVRTEAVKGAGASLDAVVERLEAALDLLDRTSDKVLDMYMLLPVKVRSRLRKSTFEIFDRIGQVHSDMASVSETIENSYGE